MDSETKKGLQFLSRFSLPPNSLGYCGKNTASDKFKSCIFEGDYSGVKSEVIKFPVLNPYLNTIAKITGLNKYSYKVVESYWLGNDTLKKFKSEHYNLLLSFFSKQGVPENLITELKNHTPKYFIPTHLFQVLHVGVGKATGSVPYNIDSIRNCMIRWGKVVKISNNSAVIRLNSIKKVKKCYKITKTEESLPIFQQFLPRLKSGDTVAVHWKQVIKILSKREETHLAYWTKETLKYFC